MAPSSERRLLRPSVEARVQLDRVELLCVAVEPVFGCQRRLVQDGVPVVVAPSRRPDPDVTHASPNRRLLPTESCWRWLTHIHIVSSPQLIALGSRPAGLPNQALCDLGSTARKWKPNRVNVRPVRARKELNMPDGPDVVLLSGSVSPHP